MMLLHSHHTMIAMHAHVAHAAGACGRKCTVKLLISAQAVYQLQQYCCVQSVTRSEGLGSLGKDDL